MPSRRDFLTIAVRAAAAAGVTGALPSDAAAAAGVRPAFVPSGPWAPREGVPIGVQLYTVRADMAKDFEGTLAAVAKIGFRDVEFAGYFDHSPADVAAILRRNGLSAPSAHFGIEVAGDGFDRTLADAKTMGHEYIVVASLPSGMRGTADEYRRVAERFNRAGEQAKAAGLRFAYHNHDFEFEPIDGGNGFDVLLKETDPALVSYEMDLFWITKAGKDPLAYFARHPGRFPMVHVKDSAGPPEHRMLAVGDGAIDFNPIFAQRARAGTRHFYVEHDEPQPNGLESIRRSYLYLSKIEPFIDL
jgi:sugar phosphate isomerase/epimerase